MRIKDLVRIECLKQNKTLADIARVLEIDRHNYYFHLRNETEKIIEETEKILNLKKGYFKEQIKK